MPAATLASTTCGTSRSVIGNPSVPRNSSANPTATWSIPAARPSACPPSAAAASTITTVITSWASTTAASTSTSRRVHRAVADQNRPAIASGMNAASRYTSAARTASSIHTTKERNAVTSTTNNNATPCAPGAAPPVTPSTCRIRSRASANPPEPPIPSFTTRAQQPFTTASNSPRSARAANRHGATASGISTPRRSAAAGRPATTSEMTPTSSTGSASVAATASIARHGASNQPPRFTCVVANSALVIPSNAHDAIDCTPLVNARLSADSIDPTTSTCGTGSGTLTCTPGIGTGMPTSGAGISAPSRRR